MTGAERTRGFTLVEVMVALTLLSLVLLAVATGMRTLGNTQDSLQRVTARVDEVRTVSGFLRDLMESAVVGSGGGLSLGGGALETTYFHLGEDYLEWKTNLLFGEAYGGTHIVRLAREGDELVLRWLEPTVVQPRPKDWAQAPSRPLIHELQEFSVSMRPEFTADWVDRWQQDEVAPALVRMQIKAAGRFWPELIMQVQR